MSNESLPTKAYDLYVEGLKGLIKHYGLSLDQARIAALADAEVASADEHLPLIEAAYQYLLTQQKTG